jgi:alkaline phosphatase D
MRTLKRREFFELIIVSAGGLAACGSDAERATREEPSPARFPQSVASGDPRPHSVVLWTRVVDEERPGDDLELHLTVALDPGLRDVVLLSGERSLLVPARAAADHCVKVRVDGLEPDTIYHYVFRYQQGGVEHSSVVGRTRTAPSENADRLVRFACVSCQDYNQRYYHLYRWLAERDLDFVVHLGDYVYETHDPEASHERRVVFGAPDDALRVTSSRGGKRLLAARSLDNYRDLYRTYRSDPDLKHLHERVPMILIPDDHEFSNDCHGATATYEEGRTDETDVARRNAADQAWFEYTPIDVEEVPARAWDAEARFPDTLRFQRRFVFGQHVELVMTDLRRYRPDHVVPEDAFPGALFALEHEIESSDDLVAIPSVDLESAEFRGYGEWLRENAGALGFRAEALRGRLSVVFVNAQLAELPDAAPPDPIDPETPGLERGYAYHQLLKNAEFSSAGARYLVGADAFEALARKRFIESEGASERMMGDAQRAWFLETLRQSTRTFKLWGSSLSFMRKSIDLRGLAILPPDLQKRILITAEDWDGCPNERRALLRELAPVENLIVLAGDLHCFFVGTPFDGEDPETRLIEFVTGAVSSSPWLKEILAIVQSDPTVPEGAALVASTVGNFLMDPVARPNPHLVFQDLERNGVTLFSADSRALEAELVMIPPEIVAKPPEAMTADVDELATIERFRVRAATGELERVLDGQVWRWEAQQGRWIRA